ncbi:MAG: membrane protein insertion efficiency factor YidD [Proteobacteria bacterium]|nr:membrane protein insertion efficiency factor YidD [Pseudomonadota bacterium]MCP4920561.1 membrane protein insertion efficiency factor YidD [Pseudomonadota bacterium]
MWMLLGTANADVPSCTELSPPAPPASQERVGMARNAAWLALRGWQIVVAPADGAGCNFYPSCSRYAMFAIAEEGAIRGTFMATARILRHHKDPDYRRCRAGERVFVYDPPSEDVWW